MKIILSSLTILASIDLGYMGNEGIENKYEDIHTPHHSPPLYLSNRSRRILDVYHRTDPLNIGHANRMNEELHVPRPKHLRNTAVSWIDKMCAEWQQITGLNQKETHELLDSINLSEERDGPDLEGRIRDKLVRVRPDFRKIDPEIIRSVVHEWHRSIKRAIIEEERMGSIDNQADLLYIYNQVQSGEGFIYDRLAEKWHKLHPDFNYRDKIVLLNRAKKLSESDPGLSSQEMEKARERYERVFGFGSDETVNPTGRVASEYGRIRTKKDKADLLYTYYQVHSGEGHMTDRLAKKWEQFHPNLNEYTQNSLLRKAISLTKFHDNFSSKEMEEAKMRYEGVFGAGSGISFEKKPKRNVPDKEGRIRLKEDQADLFYTYNQVRTGEGNVLDRLANKWKQFHPHLSNYSSTTLFKKANDFSKISNMFSPEEMEAARERYESVFGSERPIRKGRLGKDGRIQTKEERADLLYTYYQVRSGKGHISDRLLQKWQQLHPHSTNYRGGTLFNKAYELSHAEHEFTADEMEAARLRYEKVFGSGDTVSRKRLKWEGEPMIDLAYLTNRQEREEFDSRKLEYYWRLMHPEFAPAKRSQLMKKQDNIKRKSFKLTAKDEAAAESRLRAALARQEQSYQSTIPIGHGNLLKQKTSDEQNLHQEEPDWMVHSPRLHDPLQLNSEERKDLEMWMNWRAIDQPPTPSYSPLNFNYDSYSPTTSHSHFDSSTYNPYTVNPYYEHGSSSHSHHNPNINNPHYEHGGSSHSHYNPNTNNPHYEHGGSSHSHYDPHTANPYNAHDNSSHSKDKSNTPRFSFD